MAVTYWAAGVGGNWNNVSFWTNGQPDTADDAFIDAAGAYKVTLSDSRSVHDFTLDAAGATFSQLASSSLSVSGTAYFLAGTAALRGSNAIAAATIDGARVELASAHSLGGASLSFLNGWLVARHTMNLGNELSMGGTIGFAAAHDRMLTLSDGNYDLQAGLDRIVFGGPSGSGGLAKNGVVRWMADNGIDNSGHDYTIEVAAGTLKGTNANDGLARLMPADGRVIVQAGATLDVGANDIVLHNLSGGGTIVGSGGLSPVVFAGGTFAGSITGKLALDVVDHLVLTGSNSYALGTVIDPGAVLTLGNGGTSGSITGGVLNLGTLVFNRSDSVTFAKEIAGVGSVRQLGNGVTTLSHVNIYFGETIVSHGTLVAGRDGALGTGIITLTGGELCTATSQTLFDNQLVFRGNATLAAAHGTTLTVNCLPGWMVDLGTKHVRFGAAGDDGTIVWNTTFGSSVFGDYKVDVNAGTFKAGFGDFAFLFSHATGTYVAANAVLDVNGTPLLALDHLTGLGLVKNSGAAATLELSDTAFGGQIGANITVHIDGTVTLTGGGAFENAVVEEGATLHLRKTANEDVHFAARHSVLVLDNPNQFHGTVSGFVKTDRIDLTSVDFATASFSFDAATDVLTVTDGVHAAHVQFEDGYQEDDFGLAHDAHDHVLITSHLLVAPLDPFLELG